MNFWVVRFLSLKIFHECIFSKLGSRFLWENARVELHSFCHVALDLHFAVHEGILRLQFTSVEVDEVAV